MNPLDPFRFDFNSFLNGLLGSKTFEGKTDLLKHDVTYEIPESLDNLVLPCSAPWERVAASAVIESSQRRSVKGVAASGSVAASQRRRRRSVRGSRERRSVAASQRRRRRSVGGSRERRSVAASEASQRRGFAGSVAASQCRRRRSVGGSRERRSVAASEASQRRGFAGSVAASQRRRRLGHQERRSVAAPLAGRPPFPLHCSMQG